MAEIIFWEKPGCGGNARQKEILHSSGHELTIRNLLSEEWNEEKLMLFLETLPVSDWFNPAHPRIKSGEVQPEDLNRREALDLLLGDPLFIHRPLLQIGELRLVGFDVERVHRAVGLNLDAVGGTDPRHCPCVSTAAKGS